MNRHDNNDDDDDALVIRIPGHLLRELLEESAAKQKTAGREQPPDDVFDAPT